MKNIVLISIIVLISLLCYAFYAPIQTSQESELIIGTWIPKGDPGGRWVFYENGTLERFDENKLYKTYNYEIYEGKSVNGKFTFSFLRSTNVSNPDDVYEYEINALGEEKMALEYLGGTRSASGLLFFTKKAIAPH